MGKTLKGFLVDPAKHIAEPVSYVDDLKSFYKLLDCDCIDMMTIANAPATMDAIFDDEFLVRRKGGSADVAYSNGPVTLMGAVLFVGIDEEEGSCIDLTEEQFDWLARFVVRIKGEDGDTHPGIFAPAFL